MKNGAAKKTASAPPSVRQPTFDLSDTGNAHRLGYHFADRIKYVEKWQMWIVYTGKVWERDEAGVRMLALGMQMREKIKLELGLVPKLRKPAIYGWHKQSGATARIRAAIDLAKALPGVTVEHERLDQHPFLLNCKNGTVDLVSGKLRRHDPADLLTKILPWAYDSKAKAPKFEKFLKTVMPNVETRSFLQRFAGYCATGDVSERMFVILHGGGRNGKSVFLRCLQRALGPYATSAAPGLLMAKEQDAHPTEVADLRGVRLAVASEVRKGRVFDEEAVKRLTGNDRLKARFMRENFWEFDPTHKLLIAANHKPRVRDASDSFWDRIALVGFDVRISEAKLDLKLPSKLDEEMQGILAWIVEGCRLWREIGLQPPAVVKQATKEYRESEDVVGKFFNERCVVDLNMPPLDMTPTSSLIRAVKIWCENNNLYAFSEKDLVERLRDVGCQPRRTNEARGWWGVKLIGAAKVGARDESRSRAPDPRSKPN